MTQGRWLADPGGELDAEIADSSRFISNLSTNVIAVRSLATKAKALERTVALRDNDLVGNFLRVLCGSAGRLGRGCG